MKDGAPLVQTLLLTAVKDERKISVREVYFRSTLEFICTVKSSLMITIAYTVLILVIFESTPNPNYY